MIGGRMIRVGAVASTNDAAARCAADGEPEGTALIAAEQFAGRGRQGRPWHAPAGCNISCSLILRPSRPVREWPDLCWVLAAAVAAFARAAGAPGAVLKHPNDVLAGGRKLAGVLLETRTGCGGPAALVVGVGLNVNPGVEDFPPDLRATATSLRLQCGRHQDCEGLLSPLFAQLDSWYTLWTREGAAGALRRLESEGLGTAASLGVDAGALEVAAGCARGEAG